MTARHGQFGPVGSTLRGHHLVVMYADDDYDAILRRAENEADAIHLGRRQQRLLLLRT